MSVDLKSALKKVINQYGTDTCANPKRLKGILSDLSSEDRRGIKVLITAIDEKVVEELLQADGENVTFPLFTRLYERLHRETGLDITYAEWAVRCWAEALNKKIAEPAKQPITQPQASYTSSPIGASVSQPSQNQSQLSHPTSSMQANHMTNQSPHLQPMLSHPQPKAGKKKLIWLVGISGVVVMLAVIGMVLGGTGKKPEESVANSSSYSSNSIQADTKVKEEPIISSPIEQERVPKKEEKKSSYQAQETDVEMNITYWQVSEAQVNLRNAPTIASTSIGTLIKDEKVKYLHSKFFDPTDGRTWYQVQTSQGNVGWVSSRVLLKAVPDNRMDMVSGDVIKYWKVTEKQANLRAEPNIQSASTGIVYKDQQLKFLQQTIQDPNDGRTWYQVEAEDGKIGWISSRVVIRG